MLVLTAAPCDVLTRTASLINTFSGYGPLTVEWPGKDGKHPRCPPKGNVAKGKLRAGRQILFLVFV